MSTAATAQQDGHRNLIIDNKKLLMWLFLGSDCMFFGTLISTHLIYRKLYPEEYDPTHLFSLELTSFSTFILLMSSFLMALSVSAMHKGELKSFRRNVIGVILFGLIFLGCQVYEFTHFVHEGLTLSTGTFGSTFYLMTGTHGTHVAIGVFWLTCMLFHSYSGKMDAHESAVDVEVAGLYWHFVDIVWIVIFTAVYLIEFI
ncbi:cytochrome c oxidase subunit 3 [Coraliomargarita parva]|uniref:cytochrome c oxidase subunit 3 n=1 Tax=Coraliomargarita parva TaxID=3014050 RepID=UPI0022B5BC0E|nr:cytochrome c oxidase subunit 3 [Coraliomargarita parva]